jgi:hypothetical protein
MRIAALFFLLTIQVSALADDQPAAPPEPLKAWQGTWNVIDNQASAGIKFVIGEQLGLSGKDVKATIHGNQLLVGDKLIATLTTDFSQSNLDVEKQVWHLRKPILLTLPNGKGIMCAAQILENGFIEIVHPHTMGRVGAGSRITLQRPKK